jgi:hypothetical protein
MSYRELIAVQLSGGQCYNTSSIHEDAEQALSGLAGRALEEQ